MNGISPSALPDGPITEAVAGKDWPAARQAIAEKLARCLDATDSARDVKGLARELVSVLDSTELDQRANIAIEESPLAALLREADEQDKEIAALRAV